MLNMTTLFHAGIIVDADAENFCSTLTNAVDDIRNMSSDIRIRLYSDLQRVNINDSYSLTSASKMLTSTIDVTSSKTFCFLHNVKAQALTMLE